jgi:uncharacterized cupredoxin-like copper-binding protein
MTRVLRSRTALLSLAVAASIAAACSKANNGDSVVAGVSAVVFIKRAHTVVAADGTVSVNVANGNGQVLDYERYVPGGSLNVLKPARPDGKLANITVDSPNADFNGADVSFDAREVVFSMKRDETDHYHIYTASLTPGVDGKFEVHQKTAGDYDDINPIYIPGSKIAFVTNQMYTQMGTRADEYEHGRVVTQLASISVDGGEADRRLFSQNLSHTVAPFLRSDGKIGYSRWEHLGPVNDVKLLVANPDGTNMLAIGGQHGKPSNALFSVRETEPNVMIGIATSRNRTIHAGALVKIDARNKADAACLDPKADTTGHACLDEENVVFTNLTPDVPTGNAPSPIGRYREPSMLPDGRILVSWAEGVVNDQAEQSVTPPDFGVYLYDPTTKKNQLLYNDRNTWELNALPVVARTEPPVISDSARSGDASEPVRMGSIDITQTSLKDTVSGAQFDNTPLGTALKDAVKVRIIEGFSSEAAKGVTMFGLTMHEGAAVLGEATVYKDGSWLANVPPYLPVHLQPIDKFGLAIRNQMLWIQGMPGEDRRCVGCHESRTGQGVPRGGANPTVAEQRTAESFIQAVAERAEYPWTMPAAGPAPASPVATVQKLLNEKCVSCHSGGAGDPFAGKTYKLTSTDPATGASTSYTIPYLDLSDKPITVVYDRMVETYATSYVSIFYPSSMEMGMGQTKVTGDMPPKWGIPGDARGSALIAAINVKAADGTTAWPEAKKPLHPENKGITLTDAERQTLIRVMDLGGQYYARKNTGFAPYTNGDPVAAGRTYP